MSVCLGVFEWFYSRSKFSGHLSWMRRKLGLSAMGTSMTPPPPCDFLDRLDIIWVVICAWTVCGCSSLFLMPGPGDLFRNMTVGSQLTTWRCEPSSFRNRRASMYIHFEWQYVRALVTDRLQNGSPLRSVIISKTFLIDLERTRLFGECLGSNSFCHHAN